jgi:hypothetical protein
MKTLEDAWRWYVQTKRQVFLVRRLADLHWSELPWDGRLGNDDHFKELDPEQLKDDADFNLSQFDDLAVLVLFAVFESLVRDQLGTEIRAEIEEKGISHALLLRSFQDLEQQVGEGSFFRILEPYKRLHANLVEEVNQVRRYRNWVAHGRRSTRPEWVGPRMAYERLGRFWALLSLQAEERDEASSG